MRLALILFSLTLWSCARGAMTMTVPIKEAPVSSDGAGPRWLDNQRVVFRTVAPGKSGDDRPVYV